MVTMVQYAMMENNRGGRAKGRQQFEVCEQRDHVDTHRGPSVIRRATVTLTLMTKNEQNVDCMLLVACMMMRC